MKQSENLYTAAGESLISRGISSGMRIVLSSLENEVAKIRILVDTAEITIGGKFVETWLTAC